MWLVKVMDCWRPDSKIDCQIEAQKVTNIVMHAGIYTKDVKDDLYNEE